MKAAGYEKRGKAREALQAGEFPEPNVGKGEVRVRVYASGVNPSATKNRSAWEGLISAVPKVIPPKLYANG